MTKIQPVVFTWEDGGMRPHPRYLRIAKRQFEEGREYVLAPVSSRNMAFHNAFFAQIHDGWMNLPEKFAARFPSPEHLRHWLLIETGQCDEEEIEFDTKRDADTYVERVRIREPYARIRPFNNTVIVRRAHSQALANMNAKDFDESARAVLDLLAGLLGISPTELRKNAGRAA